MSAGWIIKSCVSWSLWHINSHRNVSVIEKGGDNEKKNSQGMRSFRSVPGLSEEGKALTTHFAMCWRTCQYVAFCGIDGEKIMKRVRNTEKQEVGEERNRCGSAIMCSCYPPNLQYFLKVKNGSAMRLCAYVKGRVMSVRA